MKSRVLVYLGLWLLSCVVSMGQLSTFFKGESLLIMPKFASAAPAKYLKGVEMISVRVPSLVGSAKPFKEMPIIEAQEAWRNTKKGDKVYDLTDWFPNANSKGKEDLWVYYNVSSGYLVAMADAYLRASVFDYALSLKEVEPLQIRIIGSYLEVSDSVPLNVVAIKNSKPKEIARFSTYLGNGEKATVIGAVAIELEAVVNSSSEGVNLTFYMSKTNGASLVLCESTLVSK